MSNHARISKKFFNLRKVGNNARLTRPRASSLRQQREQCTQACENKDENKDEDTDT